METSIITALAAAGGSIVGAAASLGTTWINQHKQTVRELTQASRREREALWEFITEASRRRCRLPLLSLEKLVTMYAILGRIRLISSEGVLAEAEASCQRIVELYARPNISVEQIDGSFDPDNLDPLKTFSSACRAELARTIRSF